MTSGPGSTVVHTRAPGKINVFLKVGSLLDDGYHDVAIAYQAAFTLGLPYTLDPGPAATRWPTSACTITSPR